MSPYYSQLLGPIFKKMFSYITWEKVGIGEGEGSKTRFGLQVMWMINSVWKASRLGDIRTA